MENTKINIRLIKEIDNLKKKILALGTIVEEFVQLAVKAINQRDENLAQKIIDRDEEIDRMEVELEEDCLKLLALYQPVASDLRFIIAVLKINNDLERIGDLAVNIAQRAQQLSKKEKVNIPFDYPTMSEKVKAMLRNSLDSLVNLDAKLANEVCLADNEVDEIHRGMYKLVEEAIRNNVDKIESITPYLGVSRLLERIADHATNIAEDVIYMIEGEIVRHKKMDY
jgi:phosphate transport system protein